MRCSICPKTARYFDHPNGPMCPRCWTGIKAFEFQPKRLARARKFLLGLLKEQKLEAEVVTDTPRYGQAQRRTQIKQLVAEQRADANDKNYRFTKNNY